MGWRGWKGGLLPAGAWVGQIVVRHEHHLCITSAVAAQIVRTHVLPFPVLAQILDVQQALQDYSVLDFVVQHVVVILTRPCANQLLARIVLGGSPQLRDIRMNTELLP
eukprot:566220-Rhodomonas_salina.4